MKVLHIGKFCPPAKGGMETFAQDLVRHLNKNGVEAHLFCFDKHTYKNENLMYFAFKTDGVFFSAPFSLALVRYFLKVQNNYDIIHIHTPNPLAEVLSFFTNKPVVIQWQSDIIKQKLFYRFYKPFQQRALQKASKIICALQDYLDTSEQLKEFKDKTAIIPLGVDTKRLEDTSFDYKYNSIKDKLKGKKIILSIGRLVYYKGFEYLIESAKYLPDDFLILIIGDGYLFDKLNNMIKSRNLEQRIILLGEVENINPFLKNCDIFCLPSIGRAESFGIVLVEALYYKKPLITTNVYGSGLTYINKDNQTGLVVPPKDPKAIADAIIKILSDKDMYDRFSKASFERFQEFDITNTVNLIVNLYKSI